MSAPARLSRSGTRNGSNGHDGRRAALSPAAKVHSLAPEQVPPVAFEHEELVVRRGSRSNLDMAVAIHSTALGPALGGVRLWRYGSAGDAARDALRLSRGMTMKAAAAGLDLGGGKGVISAPTEELSAERRRAALLDFGDLVESLEGRYITAEDVGIAPEDLLRIGERTAHLTGMPAEHGGSGDPSPLTAMGVEAALRACFRDAFGSDDMDGRRVAIAGVGHVGGRLAHRLAAAGAELLLADVDDRKRALAAELGARWVAPDELASAECDAFAPCALGGAIHKNNVELLRCAVVCGSANNALASDSLAKTLMERGIVYAPDFIANAGGLINVYGEIRGYGPGRVRELVHGIEGTIERVLAVARRSRTTPLAAAYALAEARLTGQGDPPRALGAA